MNLSRPIVLLVSAIVAGGAETPVPDRGTGALYQAGKPDLYQATEAYVRLEVVLEHAQNELGVARREFRIVCGEQIALDGSLLPGTVPRRSGDQVLLPYLPYQILGLRVRSCPATDPSPSNTEKEPEHA